MNHGKSPLASEPYDYVNVSDGCCHSTARDDDQSSPYAPSNAHGDSSSRAITSATNPAPELSSPPASSHASTAQGNANQLVTPAQTPARSDASLAESVGADAVNNDAPQLGDNAPEPPRPTCWERAVENLRAHNSEVFKKLTSMETMLKARQEDFTLKEPPDLMTLLESKKRKAGGLPLWSQSVIRSILALKDVFAIAAAFDPHKAAPVVWKGFCVILEATLNDSSQLQDSDLNVNDVTSKIKHWATVEMFYISAGDRAVVDRFKELEVNLVKLYGMILEFEVEVFHWCKHGLLVQLLLSTERKERWKSMAAKVKTYHDVCSSTFDDCKTKSDQHMKIKRWICADDAEDTHNDVLAKTEVNGRYQNCGQWLIDGDEFKVWSAGDPQSESRRPLWLRGTIGTGKTTLMCRVIQWHLDRRCLYPDHRFAYFYCLGDKSSKTPFEKVLLALLRQAAYSPITGEVSSNILDAYKIAGGDTDQLKPLVFGTSEKYQQLLGGILQSGIRLRIMIDALDQCDKPAELLKILRDSSHGSPSGLELLVSSQVYVEVDKKLPQVVKIDVNASMPADDMSTYVTMQVKGREKDERLLEGEHEELEDQLIETLCNKSGNMFRWVELQLGFFLGNDRSVIDTQVKTDIEKLKNGPVADEKALYATYDSVFERNTRIDTLDRTYASKIFRLLLCSVEPLRLACIGEAFASDDGNPNKENLSDAKVFRFTRDFTYVTLSGHVKFAHVSAIDYFRHYREDHEDYKEAACHAETAVMCMRSLDSPEYSTIAELPLYSVRHSFPQYAISFWACHCAELSGEEGKRREMTEILVAWLVDTPRCFKPFPEKGCHVSRIKTSMILASICNFIEVGEAAVKTQQSAGKSPADLVAAENCSILPIGLQELTLERHGYRTPLSWAADYASKDMLQLLLKHDQNPDGHKNLEVSPLMYAAENGNKTIIERLLQQTNVNPDYQSSGGPTALSYAAKTGQLRIIQLLLRNGADPEKSDSVAETALFHAVKHGQVAVVEFLAVEQKVECDGQNRWGHTPLFFAIEKCNTEIAKLLLESGASSKTEDGEGISLLSHAVLKGHLSMAKLLLKRGADLESGGWSRRTPLIYAAQSGHLNMAKLLLESGANPGVEAFDGETPLSHAARAEAFNMVHLLIEHGADPEKENKDGERALTLAMRGVSFAAVVFLLHKIKVDYNSQDGFGYTPLASAVRWNKLKVAALLLKLGAKTEVASNDGTTPLSQAVQVCNLPMARLLLKFGANSEAVDGYGKTPLWYAEEFDHQRLIRLLKSHEGT